MHSVIKTMQKPTVQQSNLGKPKQNNTLKSNGKRNPWAKLPEKTTAISLTIKKRGQNHYYIGSLPIQKIQKLQTKHKNNGQQQTWKLSQDKTTILLL